MVEPGTRGLGGAVCLLVAVCATLRVAARAQLGIDLTVEASVEQMQCLQGENLFFTTRIFEAANGGECDPSGTQNLRTAAGVGYSSAAHAYIEPDPQAMVAGTLSPAEQVDMATACGNSVGLDSTRYTINVLQDSSHPWPECNIAGGYVIDMVKELWHYSDIATIFTSKEDWVKVTCQGDPLDAHTVDFTSKLHAAADDVHQRVRQPLRNTTSDTSGQGRGLVASAAETPHDSSMTAGTRYGDHQRSILRLWYLSWDGEPNFNDFVPFGPFKTPYAKQYAQKRHLCGIPCNDDVDSSSSFGAV